MTFLNVFELFTPNVQKKIHGYLVRARDIKYILLDKKLAFDF